MGLKNGAAVGGSPCDSWTDWLVITLSHDIWVLHVIALTCDTSVLVILITCMCFLLTGL